MEPRQRKAMTRIAFLGLGAMGSRMPANLLRSGHALILWNRNPDAAETSMAVGAGNTLEKGPSLGIDMADRRSVVAEHRPRIHPHGGTT